MLKIYVIKSKEYLDTDDTDLSLTATSPIFDADYTQRIFSFDISLKRTPKNDVIFKHAYRLDDANDIQSTPLSIHLILDNVVIPLSLYVQETRIETYKILIKNDNRQILKSLDSLELRNLGYTAPIANYTPLAPARIVLDIADNRSTTLSLRLAGKTYFETAASTSDNDLFIAAGALRNAINADFQNLVFLTTNNLLPQFILQLLVGVHENIVLDPIAIIGFKISDVRPITLHRQEAIQQFLDVADNRQRADFVFPLVRNGNLYNFTVNEFKYYINSMYDAVLEANLPTPNKNTWQNTLVPFFRVAFVISKIAERLGLTLQGEWLTDDDLKSLILYNLTTLDEVSEDLQADKLSIHKVNHFQDSVTMANHIPNVKAIEFLGNLCKQYSLYYTQKGKNLVFKSKKKLLKKPTQNWTSKIEVSTITYTRNEQNGLVIKPVKDPTDGIYEPIQLQDKIIGKGLRETKLPYGTLPMTLEDRSVPRSEQIGNSKAANVENKDMLFRLLYFRGEIPSTEGNYLFATHRNKSFSGTTYGNESMDFNGPDNFYETRLKGIIELDQAEPVEFTAYISAQDYWDFIEEKYSTIVADTVRGKLKCLIKEIKIKYKNKGIQEAHVIGVRIR